jgi:hypothetical protein
MWFRRVELNQLYRALDLFKWCLGMPSRNLVDPNTCLGADGRCTIMRPVELACRNKKETYKLLQGSLLADAMPLVLATRMKEEG